jgi:hypothetical protein
MTVETPSTSKVYQTNSAPSDLLSRFITQYEELLSYKYVSYVGFVLLGQHVNHSQGRETCSLGWPIPDHSRRCWSGSLRNFGGTRRCARNPRAHGKVTQRARGQGASSQKCVRREHRSRWQRYASRSCFPRHVFHALHSRHLNHYHVLYI